MDRSTAHSHTPRRPSIRRFLALLALALPLVASATPPLPFAAKYEARYGGFKASAERSLQTTDDGIEMNTRLELKLLGKTISRIHEASSLATDDSTGELRPVSYSFEQTGLGSRSRSVSFDWDSAVATTLTGNQENTIELDGPAMDNLSGYIAMREQLLDGKTEVSFLGIDKGKKEEFHYSVIGEEILETTAGQFRALKLERIRDEASHRSTEIWLALDWDYLLIRLVQREPGSNTIMLDLTHATVDGQPVSTLTDG